MLYRSTSVLRLFGVIALAATAAMAATRQPNILFILADDHASEAISCYGSYLKDFARTPNIDRIAREGMRFDNVCCNNSICSPSRASILTGQYSHRNGVRGLNGTIVEGAPWVSVELQKAGYQTAVYGKWHLQNTPLGFNDYGITKGQGKYFDPTLTTPRGNEKHQGYATDVYTDIALKWLQQRDPNRPFCLMLHFKAPHHPYDYPERMAKLLEGVRIPEPPNLYEDVAKTSPLLKARHRSHMDGGNSYYERHKRDKEPPMEPAPDGDVHARIAAAYQHMMHKYIRCISANDDNVGRLLRWLDDQGLRDNTVVIYTSDQGYWLGQHGLYDKRLILEESLKMPFVVRYPAEIRPGSVCAALCSNVDFAETLLDFAGTPVPAAMQGRSMRPWMRGEAPTDWRRAVFYCYWSGPAHWGVRTERYTLAHFPGTEEIEFYDRRADRWQMTNQAQNATYAGAIAECERVLTALMRRLGITADQLPKGHRGKKNKQRQPKGDRKGRRGRTSKS